MQSVIYLYLTCVSWFYRKCKMNCLPVMQHNFWRRSILDVLHCFGMTRFDQEAHFLTVYGINQQNWPLIHCLLQVEDLSRMYRLFSKITRGLEPISNMFKTVLSIVLNSQLSFPSLTISPKLWFNCTSLQHVTNEGTALVKQAEDSANNKKVQSLTSAITSFVHLLVVQFV